MDLSVWRQHWGWTAFGLFVAALWLILAATAPAVAIFLAVGGGVFWAGLYLGYKAARDQDIETVISQLTQRRKDPPDEPGQSARV